jgi:pyruvate/2-oxoglutarate dehydrogenase complex dihydrolipoamide dehydrogenase (E3) component
MTARTAARYDAVVVGGGHNGLVAAARAAIADQKAARRAGQLRKITRRS